MKLRTQKKKIIAAMRFPNQELSRFLNLLLKSPNKDKLWSDWRESANKDEVFIFDPKNPDCNAEFVPPTDYSKFKRSPA
jgi:hypothetical protein